MTLRAWAELLRVSALFTVPGDALAGAASAGLRPNRGTALAVGASLCLYEAGMALNDWSDREEDAVERPHRPIPSGRITPGAALTAAAGLTAAGLFLAARAGRPSLALSTALAATVWSYDLTLKHTPAGPAAMGAARALDLLLGATATRGRAPAVRAGSPVPAAALAPAALLGAHTVAVTTVSRSEVYGGSTAGPLAALAATGVLGVLVGRARTRTGAGHGPVADGAGVLGAAAGRPRTDTEPAAGATPALVTAALAAAYAVTAGRPFLHAALNPSPPLTRRAVGGGIRAMIPLQAALAARGGSAATGAAVMALVPLAKKFGRKVSVT